MDVWHFSEGTEENRGRSQMRIAEMYAETETEYKLDTGVRGVDGYINLLTELKIR